jgi:hypothetical protein
MRTVCRWLIVTIVLCGAPPQAQEPDARAQVAVEGAGQLRAVGQARRTHLLGTIDLYTVAIYSNGGGRREDLASANVAKAMRFEVTYTDDLRRPVEIDWRRELVPRLKPQAMAHLQRSFAPIRQGDVVSVDYAPTKGTSIRVNKAVVVSEAHHDLMLAFLEHWLGERPVSEELKRALLAPV